MRMIRFFIRPSGDNPLLIISIFLALSIVSIPMNAHIQDENAENKAAKIKILSSTFEKELLGIKAPVGKIFVICETEWKNIHPKQKVDKDKLEGKTDRTMGVGGLAGKKTDKKVEYVEVDVAYQVRKLSDHVYLLADGMAFSLNELTENIPGGFKIKEPFTIAKQGEIKKVKLAFLVPQDRDNLGFHMFDYQYGHVLLPVKGELKKARGTGELSGNILGQAGTEMVEIAAHSLEFRQEYMGNLSAEGWRYAVVQLSGKSLSGENIRNIVQFKPEENTWMTIDGGYLYYSAGSSTALNGFIRFTPEVFQDQELAFLVPESAINFKLGIRAENQVMQLILTKNKPVEFPVAKTVHKDGEVLEVFLFGIRNEQDKTVLDLGIRSLYEKGGLEIQTNQQFILLVREKEHKVDRKATDSLFYHPPQPFVVPPGISIRFELAFNTTDSPASLRFRGYRSEGILKF